MANDIPNWADSIARTAADPDLFRDALRKAYADGFKGFEAVHVADRIYSTRDRTED